MNAKKSPCRRSCIRRGRPALTESTSRPTARDDGGERAEQGEQGPPPDRPSTARRGTGNLVRAVGVTTAVEVVADADRWLGRRGAGADDEIRGLVGGDDVGESKRAHVGVRNRDHLRAVLERAAGVTG